MGGPGSLELLGTLLRRPPQALVLLALAVRPRQVPEKLLAALERANRAGTLTRLELSALSREDAKALHGNTTDSVYDESGGNPFYLQQLARSLDRTGQVPRDVTAALSEELALLGADARRLLQGAAVAGDPFVPEALAAAAAGVSEHQALDALDELLRTDLVRTTDVPRRFRFRHPLVRRAVYDDAPAGWRLGAHERAAQALPQRRLRGRARPPRRALRARRGPRRGRGAAGGAGSPPIRRRPPAPPTGSRAALRLLPGETSGAADAGLVASGATAASPHAVTAQARAPAPASPRPRARADRRVRRRSRRAARGARGSRRPASRCAGG